jgi:hypothetical protein
VSGRVEGEIEGRKQKLHSRQLNFSDINSLNMGRVKVIIAPIFIDGINYFDILTVYSQTWCAGTCAAIKLVVFDWKFRIFKEKDRVVVVVMRTDDINIEGRIDKQRERERHNIYVCETSEAGSSGGRVIKQFGLG